MEKLRWGVTRRHDGRLTNPSRCPDMAGKDKDKDPTNARPEDVLIEALIQATGRSAQAVPSSTSTDSMLPTNGCRAPACRFHSRRKNSRRFASSSNAAAVS